MRITHAGTGDAAAAREAMVERQLRGGGIRDERVLAAMREVPREAFVPETVRDRAYEDGALPIGHGQTVSQPWVVAAICEGLELTGDEEVLEIGTGSGYQAAILAELGARVTSIERHEELAEGARQRLRAAGYEDVTIEVGDGTQGWPARAPYRSILITAGGPSVPQPLLEQLDRSGGRLVMPVGTREHQFLTLVERSDGELVSTEMEPVVFVPLIGRFGLGED